jgi:hypothetical protein
VLQETHQPFLADGVEERPDVGVQYPVHFLAVNPDHERVKRIMRAASRPEPIREPEEVLLVDRVEHRSRRSLDDLVLQRRDRERALPAVRFWDVNPPRRQCPIRSPLDPCMQILKPALKVCLVVLAGQAVHPRCGILS